MTWYKIIQEAVHLRIGKIAGDLFWSAEKVKSIEFPKKQTGTL